MKSRQGYMGTQMLPQGPELRLFHSRPLLAAYVPFVIIGARLYRGEAPSASAPAFRDLVEQELAAARALAMSLGVHQEHALDAEFAVAALINEAARRFSGGQFGAVWNAKPLEVPGRKSANAGAAFYERLDRLERAKLQDVLEIYRLTLLAGFQGGVHDTAHRASRLRRVCEFLDRAVVADSLFPPIPDDPPPAPPVRMAAIVAPAVVAVVGLMLMTVLLLAVLVHAGGRLGDRFEALAGAASAAGKGTN